MRKVDKQALIDGTCTIPSKIIINNGDDTTTELTQDDYILNWEYEDFRYVPNQGFLGQFVERVVNGKLKNVDDSFSIADKDIELQFAVDRSGVVPSEGTTISGTEISVNNVNADETSIIKLNPSELTQETTPTPDNPQDVQVIKGNNSINIKNKNLFNYSKETQVINNVNFTINDDKSIIANGTASSNTYWKLGELYLPENGTYYISGSPSDGSSSTYRITCYLHDETGTYLNAYSDKGSGISFIGNKNYRLDYYIYIANGVTVANKLFKPMVTTFQTTSYEPYKLQSFPINLPVGMEYCKIGDYEDEFEHDLSMNKWYLNKKISKIILDGSEEYYGNAFGNYYRYFIRITSLGITPNLTSKMLADYFNYDVRTLGSTVCAPGMFYLYTEGSSYIYFVTSETTSSNFKNWLSTHNTTLYYVLDTPTHEEITDSTLISQLNAIEQAGSYDEQTNISQVNTELPFNIQFTYNKVINPYWYSLGNFIVNKPTDDNVKDNTNFKAVDYTKYFETPYVDKVTYPTTAGALAYSVCKQAKTSLGNFQASLTADATINHSKQYFTYDSTKDVYNLVVEPVLENISSYYEINECFTNHDFVIENNQFVNNETCRTVMKAIGMLAYSWVRIGWDDKCYLDFEVNTEIENDHIITNDDYYDLTTKNDYFGEVNKVIIGMKDVDGENTTLVDSDSNTTEIFEITLWDNPLTYNQELREKAIVKANKLFGLKYKPVEMTTVGHPWLIGNELLSVVDMEDNTILTYPFDRTISYSGHIKTKIKSQAMSKTDTKYAYEGRLNNLGKSIKNTQIIVDKANQIIDAVVQTQEDLSDTLIPLATSNGVELKLEKSAGQPLVEFELDGNSYQETRSGKNLIDNTNGSTQTINGVTFTKNSDGTITANGTASNGVNYYINGVSTNWQTLPAGTYVLSDGVVNGESDNTYFLYLDVQNNSSLYLSTISTKTRIYSEPIAIRTRIVIRNGVTLNDVVFKPMLENGNGATEYEPPGAMPSPNYPSEAKNIETYNLFNKNNAEVLNSYHWSGSVLTGADYLRTTYISCKANTTYTISKIAGQRFALGTTEVLPANGVQTYGFAQNNTATELSLTTPSNAKYLIVGFYNTNADTAPYEEMLNSIKIVEGSVMQESLPYGTIGLKNVGKNLIDNKNGITETINGVTFTKNSDGTITANGTASAGVNYYVNGVASNWQTLSAGTYYLSDGIANGESDSTYFLYLDVRNSSLYLSTIAIKTRTYSETIEFRTRIVVRSGVTLNNVVFKPMLEAGNQVTLYEPYKEIITTIDLQGNFIGKLPDGTKDRLYLENGHLYLEKKVGKIIFDGNEGWIKSSNTTADSFSIQNQTIKPSSIGMSNYFTYLLNQRNVGTFYIDQFSQYIFSFSEYGNTSLEEWKSWLQELNNNGAPLIIYAELAEAQLIDLGEYSLNTLSGNSTIQLLSTLQTDMYCKYIRDVDSLDVFQTKNDMTDYYNKFETDSRISIETDGITERVESIASLVDANGTAIETVNNRVTEEITSTQAQIEVVENKVNNGVETLKNSLVTININGIQVSTNLSKISTIMTNDTFAVMSGTTRLAYFGYDEEVGRSIAEMDNLTVKNYFTAGYHRTEGFEDEETNEPRTGWFYVGGNI